MRQPTPYQPQIGRVAFVTGAARQNDINFLIWMFRFFGGLVDKLPTDFYDKGAIYTSTFQEPVGVVGEIIPFNWPPFHAGGKIAPALAAGRAGPPSDCHRAWAPVRLSGSMRRVHQQ